MTKIKQTPPWTIPPRRRNNSGTRDWLNGIETQSPTALGDVATQAFRDVIQQAGMNPFLMYVEIGPNTDILRPADEADRPQGYPYMLKLNFNSMQSAEHQRGNEIIDTLIGQLNEAWAEQHRDHKPGTIRAENLPTGERTITIAHDDLARLTNIMNKVLRQHSVESIDTRLKGLGYNRVEDTGTSR